MPQSKDSESHQGPPPERQTGAQMHDPPASGAGTDGSSNKEQTNKSALDVRHCPSAADGTEVDRDKTNEHSEPFVEPRGRLRQGGGCQVFQDREAKRVTEVGRGSAMTKVGRGLQSSLGGRLLDGSTIMQIDYLRPSHQFTHLNWPSASRPQMLGPERVTLHLGSLLRTGPSVVTVTRIRQEQRHW